MVGEMRCTSIGRKGRSGCSPTALDTTGRRNSVRTADGIAAAKHRLDKVVFVSTRTMSVQKREDLRTEMRDTHGWETEFYDIERLRALLTGPLASLVGQHPLHIRATVVRTSWRRSRISQVSRPHRNRPSGWRSRIRRVVVQPVECRWVFGVVPGSRHLWRAKTPMRRSSQSSSSGRHGNSQYCRPDQWRIQTCAVER